MLFYNFIGTVLVFLLVPQLFYGATLDEKIGHMIMIGFRGYELCADSTIIQEINEAKIGGVILYRYDSLSKQFERNIQSPCQLKKLCCTLQENASLPIFIAIDQEGGMIDHLPESLGFASLLGAGQLGTLNDPSITQQYAAICAQELLDLGINLNLAPVVDLNINPNNPVIAKKQRSYSADPELVYLHANRVVSEHQARSIFTALKHFPGHGSSEADSHEGFVDISHTWRQEELTPYERFIEKGFSEFILVGHVYNSLLDDVFSASLSHQIITELLREKMHYDGLIISDDLQMGAISKMYDLETTVYLAINAGLDILLFANQQMYDGSIGAKVHTIIKQLVASNRISEQRIDQSYQRIVNLKAKLYPRRCSNHPSLSFAQ